MCQGLLTLAYLCKRIEFNWNRQLRLQECRQRSTRCGHLSILLDPCPVPVSAGRVYGPTETASETPVRNVIDEALTQENRRVHTNDER